VLHARKKLVLKIIADPTLKTAFPKPRFNFNPPPPPPVFALVALPFPALLCICCFFRCVCKQNYIFHDFLVCFRTNICVHWSARGVFLDNYVFIVSLRYRPLPGTVFWVVAPLCWLVQFYNFSEDCTASIVRATTQKTAIFVLTAFRSLDYIFRQF
jgi:hypothetical protein